MSWFRTEVLDAFASTEKLWQGPGFQAWQQPKCSQRARVLESRNYRITHVGRDP